MIVIDVGCARYGGDYSIERLWHEFKPRVLYGFDPNPAMNDLVLESDGELNPGMVITQRSAAWTYDGEIGYLEDGLNSTLTNRTDVPMVPCFDLSEFVYSLTRHTSEAPRIVLKMDAEGSEYELLEHLIDTGADKLLELAWVEWHPKKIANGEQRRRNIEDAIHCEITEWRW